MVLAITSSTSQDKYEPFHLINIINPASFSVSIKAGAEMLITRPASPKQQPFSFVIEPQAYMKQQN